jgi:hypothetical protein
MHHKMSSIFNEKVMSEYKEYTNILENAKKKQTESFKSFSGYAKNPKKETKEESKAIGKPVKRKWLTLIFGGLFTLFGAGTLFFIIRNRNRFNI